VINGALSAEDDRMEMLQAMISVQVRGEIYFAVNSTLAAELLWIDWVFWFNRTYKDGPKKFHELALYSFEYVHWSSHIGQSEDPCQSFTGYVWQEHAMLEYHDSTPVEATSSLAASWSGDRTGLSLIEPDLGLVLVY
jgi:hypothetical protein